MRNAYPLSVALLALTLFYPVIPSPLQGQGIDQGITWYGVLKDGLKEATRTGKPILLVSAAPQCVGVSGMW